ncbi:MAG TPA: LLM class flavin-dependent oxidoreductase, partial [Actinobacteria bacterium]|nr:LLM class flavin-dependent oxidoreductase [Actinomycetota bacterium]
MPRVTVGISINSNPPLSRTRAFIRAARAMRLDSVWAVDHWLGFFPLSIWDESFSWLAAEGGSPHAYFDWPTLLGYAAERAGNLQLAVGVTEPIRQHPVQLAQTAMTLSHMTKRPPILGIGSGEAENVVPYGLDFSAPVGRLEEALEIIRLCFESDGPFDFDGTHFKLDRAILDLKPKPGNEPQVWVAAHGPRMLRLTGRFADGWYPAIPMKP